MATVPEFISVLRKIRDVIYPEIKTTYEDSLVLKESIDVGKAEFDADFAQFNTDYDTFIIQKNQVDVAVTSAQVSASSASASATIATNKSNEIKAITAQSTTGAPGTSASASYNPTDGKFTFNIPQGIKGDKGESFTVNSSGITASRTLYDAQPAGWSFLDITTSTLYFKASNTSGDWSSGVPFGKGDTGETGDTGVGIESFTYVSTNHISRLPAQSGGTDTYRVTLTNALTFEYQVYNGLDYSQELLDDKLDKDFSTFTEKVVPNSTDIFTIGDSTATFGIKKLTWTNIKATLKTYFDTLYTVASTETIIGIIRVAKTAEAQNGTDDYTAITPLKLRNALNASGTAPIYACRAWVNFNGTGTVAIRGSGNVSSITDNEVGKFTVNFTTPMPDANYSVGMGVKQNPDTTQTVSVITPTIYLASSITVIGANVAQDLTDHVYNNVSIFR